MSVHDSQKRPIDPGFLARAAQGISYAFRGVKPNNWFGPSEPIKPVAPPEVKGRAIDYPSGYNLRVKPRGDEGVSFEQLRVLADAHGLTRLCIETRKDQISKLDWSIQPKKKRGETKRAKPDDRCERIENFLSFPDRRHNWDGWLRMLIEDMLVIDAPAIYPRRTIGGDLYSLDLIDGALIMPLLEEDGRQPLAPSPAYQQVLKGTPVAQFTADELIYVPHNPRTWKIYGYSPVEQIVTTINMGIRRELSQMDFFTSGNIPEALCGVPQEWQPSQIQQFQEYWDAVLTGDMAERKKVKFLPGGMNIQFTKDAMLKDMFDEWIARVVCYAFSLPPTAFVQQQNRATAVTAQEAAIQEGLTPLLDWVRDLMNLVVAKHFDAPDLEFVWENEKELDPATRAALDLNDIRMGLKSIDEVRQERGLDPYGLGPAIFGVGSAGLTFIEDLKDPEKRRMLTDPMAQQQAMMEMQMQAQKEMAAEQQQMGGGQIDPQTGQPLAPPPPHGGDPYGGQEPPPDAGYGGQPQGGAPPEVMFTPTHQRALEELARTIYQTSGVQPVDGEQIEPAPQAPVAEQEDDEVEDAGMGTFSLGHARAVAALSRTIGGR